MKFPNNIQDFVNKLRKSLQDFPYFGTTKACDEATLPDGWLAVDTEKKQLRLFIDDVKGGVALPNVSDMEVAKSSAVSEANSYTDTQQLPVGVVFDHQLAPEPVEQRHRQNQQNELRNKAHVEVIASYQKHWKPANFGQYPEK